MKGISYPDWLTQIGLEELHPSSIPAYAAVFLHLSARLRLRLPRSSAASAAEVKRRELTVLRKSMVVILVRKNRAVVVQHGEYYKETA